MGLLLIIPVMLTIGAVIGAVLLRAGVSMANKLLGSQLVGREPLQPIGPPGTFNPDPVTTTPNPIVETLPTEQGNPYASPAVNAMPVAPSPQLQKAIREPSFGHAIGIVFLQLIATTMVNFAIGLAIPGESTGAILAFVLGFFITTGIYAGMLPTSYGKAFLVYVFVLSISFVVVLGILAVIVGISALFGRSGF